MKIVLALLAFAIICFIVGGLSIYAVVRESETAMTFITISFSVICAMDGIVALLAIKELMTKRT